MVKTSEPAPKTEDHSPRCAPALPAVRITDEQIAVDWPAAVSEETLSNLTTARRTGVLRQAQAVLRLLEAIHTDTPTKAGTRRELVKQLLNGARVKETRLMNVLPSFRMYCTAREARATFSAELRAQAGCLRRPSRGGGRSLASAGSRVPPRHGQGRGTCHRLQPGLCA